MTDAIMMTRMGVPMPRSKGRAKTEEITNPRPRNGNTYAVGAYLQKLREDRGLHREPMVRDILTRKHRNITMSMSTLGQIESGKNKSVGGATIAAIRQEVGGDPYDIDELWDLPIPDDDDENAIHASRLAGQARAIERQQIIAAGGSIRIIAENSTPDVQKILSAVAKDESLLRLAKMLADDPKALKLVQAILEARNNGGAD